MRVDLNDVLTVDGSTKTTKEGYLVVDARVARTGIQVYHGSELGLVGRDKLRVWRPEEEVFKDASLKTYAHRPVTLNHPKDGVNAQNWKQLAVGQTGDEVIRDGQTVRVPMVLMDAAVIEAVKGGIRELSMGYSCELELVDGVTPDGEPYDAVQRNLQMNHLAVVAMARGGSELRIGDTKGVDQMTDTVKTQTVVVDGLSITTTEQGAQVIEKLQKQLADSQVALQKLTSDHSAELAKRDAELDGLKAKVLTDAQFDERVKARAALIDTAKRIFPNIVADGKSDADIRRETVVAKLGDSMKAKEQTYIDVRFDILAEGSPTTQVTHTSDWQPTQATDADKAYAESLNSLNTAWQNKQ